MRYTIVCWHDASVYREKRLGAKVAVQVNGNETSIVASGGVVHRFLYDYSFWSCDSHMTTFASQEVVYKSLAQPLLDWSFEGYNTCIFAYGQVGLQLCVVSCISAVGRVMCTAPSYIQSHSG